MLFHTVWLLGIRPICTCTLCARKRNCCRLPRCNIYDTSPKFAHQQFFLLVYHINTYCLVDIHKYLEYSNQYYWTSFTCGISLLGSSVQKQNPHSSSSCCCFLVFGWHPQVSDIPACKKKYTAGVLVFSFYY
jgi:hypothetical protein